MLEFSHEPYRFFPPEPHPVMLQLGPLMNRFLLRTSDHRLGEIDILGSGETLRSLDRDRTRVLFVANHPTRTDPQFMAEIQRRFGYRSSFMAAYDIFLENRLRAWFMQKTGCFSIDREGSDRRAMSTAIDILKGGDLALTIFPEGNVYLMNDRVTPFLEGTAFIALKAHQALKEEGEVVVVPVSLKYSHLTDARTGVWSRLARLAEDSGFSGQLDPDHPRRSVVAVGGHILSRFLEERSGISGDFDFTGLSPEETQARLYDLAKRLIGELESDLALPCDDGVFIVDRIRKVRSTLHQIRNDEAALAAMGQDTLSALARQSILSFRLLAYVLPYLNEKSTLDRYSETVERLCEDFYSRNFPPLGPRRALARIGAPIPLGEILAGSGGKTRGAVTELTRRMEETVASGVAELAESLHTPGSREI